MQLLKKINTEATLDRYLELARGQKRKRLDEDAGAGAGARAGAGGPPPLSPASTGFAANLIQASLGGMRCDASKNAAHATSEELLGLVVCGPNCAKPCADPLHKNVAAILQQQQQQQQLQVLQALQGLQQQQQRQVASASPPVVSTSAAAMKVASSLPVPASSPALLGQILAAGALQAPPSPQQQEPSSARTNQSDATTM